MVYFLGEQMEEGKFKFIFLLSWNNFRTQELEISGAAARHHLFKLTSYCLTVKKPRGQKEFLCGKRPFCVLKLAIIPVWAVSLLLLAAVRCRCSLWILALMFMVHFPSVHVLNLQVNDRKTAYIVFIGQFVYTFFLLYTFIYVKTHKQNISCGIVKIFTSTPYEYKNITFYLHFILFQRMAMGSWLQIPHFHPGGSAEPCLTVP